MPRPKDKVRTWYHLWLHDWKEHSWESRSGEHDSETIVTFRCRVKGCTAFKQEIIKGNVTAEGKG